MARYSTGDPIYALATPYAPSALAVIRASGDGVISLIQPLFSSDLSGRVSGSAVHGYISDKDGRRIDEIMLLIYSSGHGYTGEEAFEIMCHGSLPVIRSISRALGEAGIREAERGEFTYRAFMHGRMDLTEAEAVEEIVSARTERAGSDALERLTGSIRREAESIKDEILDILASVEVQLDYGEDDVLYSHGATVVLAGRTNAGKSSLYNSLLKENRAIVSSEEGTPRDYIEADAELLGIPVRLFDTAGLRDADGDVEKEGIRRSRSLIDEADLVVYVLDGMEEDRYPDGERTLKVRSKRDMTGLDSGLSFSSVTGEGIDLVVNAIAERLKGDDMPSLEVPRIDSKRQLDAIKETAAALRDAEAALMMGEDVVAMYLQSALSSLSALTGEVTSEDVLERLFSSFCLGK